MGAQTRPLFPWPEKFIGPRPGLKEINVLCWAVFCLCIVAPVCFFLFIQIKTGKFFFQKSSVDFVYFYGIGEIANTHPAAEVYDYSLQLATFNSILPLHQGKYGPSPYPPFVVQFFRPFALLSFGRAYLLWILITLVLYVSGLLVLLRECLPNAPLKRSLILCFALAYYPFLRNVLVSGQLSGVAFFVVAVAVVQERRGKEIASGLLLALLAYKPTFLPLLIPMLLLTRRWKTLAGFGAGVGLLAAISTALAGMPVWPAYLHFLSKIGGISGTRESTSLQVEKYVDLNSLSYAFGARSWATIALLACTAALILVWVAVAWWRSGEASSQVRAFEWASMLAWTMLVNIYFPVYDSILLVIVVVLMLAAMEGRPLTRRYEFLVLAAVLIFAVSFFSEVVAERHGWQLLTFALLGVAIAATRSLQKAKRLVAVQGLVSTAR